MRMEEIMRNNANERNIKEDDDKKNSDSFRSFLGATI